LKESGGARERWEKEKHFVSFFCFRFSILLFSASINERYNNEFKKKGMIK